MMNREMNRTAGAATPCGPKAEIPVKKNRSRGDGSMNECSGTIPDKRLDAMIGEAI